MTMTPHTHPWRQVVWSLLCGKGLTGTRLRENVGKAIGMEKAPVVGFENRTRLQGGSPVGQRSVKEWRTGNNLRWTKTSHPGWVQVVQFVFLSGL